MFKETTKHWALNKTNAVSLAELFGEIPNDWISKRIELFTEPAKYRGKPTVGVRIKPIVPAELVEQPANVDKGKSGTWQD